MFKIRSAFPQRGSPEEIGRRQMRSIATSYRAAKEGDDLFIEGYFAVFGSNYEIWPGATESVDPHAFDDTLKNDDVRALADHVTLLVLGRNIRGTLELKVDEKGLWGRIKINRADQDAMNLYARVERGDVDQCSFGFDILEEEISYSPDGSSVHWTIKKVKLYEVSVVTFPAYEETSVAVASRKKEFDTVKNRSIQEWRIRMKERFKKNGS